MFGLAVRQNRFKFALYALKKARKATNSFYIDYGENKRNQSKMI